MNYNKKIGNFGENLAKQYLVRRGYCVNKTNYHQGNLEIDIIANIDQKIVFIEVKTRIFHDSGLAEEYISHKKIKLFKLAVGKYLEKNMWIKDFRLDLIAIDIYKYQKKANIKHYKDII